MFHFLLAALLSPTPLFDDRVNAPRDERPAIWIVRDQDTTIYLFGTFHALDGTARWVTPAVHSALVASDELVLETLVPRFAPPPPTPLPASTSTSGTGSASLLSSAKAVMSAGRSNGMSTELGADAVLRELAEGYGKRVSGLETFESQLGMFSRLPPAPRPATAVQQKATLGAMSQLLSFLQGAWSRGDIDSFTPMLDQMAVKSPDTYRLMFVERNAHWAGWIADRLDRPGTVFVAVGAGHFAGRDSVQARLAERGVIAARVS